MEGGAESGKASFQPTKKRPIAAKAISKAISIRPSMKLGLRRSARNTPRAPARGAVETGTTGAVAAAEADALTRVRFRSP